MLLLVGESGRLWVRLCIFYFLFYIMEFIYFSMIFYCVFIRLRIECIVSYTYFVLQYILS